MEKVSALLVSAGNESFDRLELALRSEGIETHQARDNAELVVLLEERDSPQMIFTDTTLPDGTWVDVLRLSAPYSVPVIVVSRLVDLELYVDCLQCGVLHFIVPSFVGADLAHVVVRGAVWNQSEGRLRQASAAR